MENENQTQSFQTTTTQPPAQTVYQVVEKKHSPWRTFWLMLTMIFIICGLCGILPLFLLAFVNPGNSTTEKGVDNLMYTYVLGNEKSENNLLAIYLDQPILTSSQDYSDDVLTSLLVGQYVFGYEVKDTLMKAAEDTSIKGVVFFVNSPGGTIVGARAIADGIAYYKEKTGKPVYAYVEDMAASGAYWASAAADKIYAEQGSLTGSIGVILGPFEYYDKLVTLGNVSAQNGITINYITGGQYKDFGNPTRKLSDDELRIIQGEVNIEYDRFVSYIAKQRKIPETTIKADIKALIYGAEKAKSYGLIDEIGNREMAIADLATASGVPNDFKVIKIGSTTSLFGSFFSAISQRNVQKSEAPARICVLCGKPLYFFGNPLDY